MVAQAGSDELRVEDDVITHYQNHDAALQHQSAATVNVSRVADCTIAALISSAHLSPVLQERAEAADVLLISNEGHVKEGVRYFPSGTTELFGFLRKNLPQALQFEAAIEEQEYQELSLHGALLNLATIACQYLIAPVIVNWLSEFLKTRITRSRMPGTMVKSRLLVFTVRTEEYLEISFTGPVADFRDLMLAELQEAAPQLKAKANHEHKPPTRKSGEASSRRKRRSKSATGRGKN